MHAKFHREPEGEKMKKIVAASLLFILAAVSLQAQNPSEAILREMRKFEDSALRTYKEYQWLYYAQKQSRAELLIFENLLSVYVKRLREAYETIALVGEEGIGEARDIAARAYIYRALTFLEKAPIDITYFEKACYDYYDALQLYEASDTVPVVFKRLPISIRIGNKYYDRLIELLDEKGEDLFAFGQVHIAMKNFKVTSKFDENMLQLVRVEGDATGGSYYTYQLADQRLKNAFREAIQTGQPEDVYLALPAGTYYIRSQKDTPQDYRNLATLYVQPNQFTSYIVEPIADWVIFYETPEYVTGTSATATGTMLAQAPLAETTVGDSNSGDGMGGMATLSPDSLGQPAPGKHQTQESIARYLETVLENMPVEELDELPIPRTRKEFIQNLAFLVSNKVGGVYLNSWNRWTFAWNIAQETTKYFKPGAPVSVTTIKLVHNVIKNLY